MTNYSNDGYEELPRFDNMVRGSCVRIIYIGYWNKKTSTKVVLYRVIKRNI